MSRASLLARSVVQVLCCTKCRECLNGHWYYPKKIYEPGMGLINNPYEGRCRNCGNTEFTVGMISTVEASKAERQLGWRFIPFMHDLNVPNPFVKNNIFIVAPKEKVG